MSLQSILEKTRLASIDNIKFYANSISSKDGNKLLIDEVPNSARWIRFWGSNEPIYTIEGMIETDLYDNFKTILLRQDGFKTLDVPFFGQTEIYIQDIEQTLFSTTIVGFVPFKITALYSSNNSRISTQTRLKVVNESKNKAKLTRLEVFKNFFISTALSINTIKSRVNIVLANIQSVTNSINALTSEVQLLSNTITTIQNTLGELIVAPSLLANSISTTLEILANSFSNIDESLIAIFNSAYLNKPNIVEISSQYALENTQAENLIQSYVLVSCCENYFINIQKRDSIFDYQMTQDINNLTQLKEISRNIYDESLKTACQNLIDTSIAYIRDSINFTKNKNTYTLPCDVSSTVLCYDLYGSLDYLSLFLKWNNLYKGQILKHRDQIIFYSI